MGSVSSRDSGDRKGKGRDQSGRPCENQPGHRNREGNGKRLDTVQGMPMHTQELQVRRWSQTLIERFDVEPLYQNPIAAMFRSEHLRRYQMTKNYIHKQAIVHNLSIVDAGCGLGYGWEYLSPFGAYIGLDHSREAILEARTRFPEGDFRTPDRNEDNAIRATVDVVVSHETAEHLESPVRFFQMVARALRTGGIFCFSAPPCLTVDYDPLHP